LRKKNRLDNSAVALEDMLLDQRRLEPDGGTIGFLHDQLEVSVVDAALLDALGEQNGQRRIEAGETLHHLTRDRVETHFIVAGNLQRIDIAHGFAQVSENLGMSGAHQIRNTVDELIHAHLALEQTGEALEHTLARFVLACDRQYFEHAQSSDLVRNLPPGDIRSSPHSRSPNHFRKSPTAAPR